MNLSHYYFIFLKIDLKFNNNNPTKKTAFIYLKTALSEGICYLLQ